MTIELTMLALSIVLGLVQIVLSAQSKNLVTGYALGRWLLATNREPTLTPVAGRLERALSNFSKLSRSLPLRCSSLTRQGGTTG